ncbi:MAG: nucleotidyltransferase domain-containing protein [Candidatus Mcinerneyibacterium aminivorans]|uniref:Nucleotidyltransferase domain-containing protein n=1 Tax=Candidatus Mcinerneyibacterium aminivorans TaxID=2703815 RepID=A0A5D0MB76_9BACT|nr:MAG: nucleotidyltransferase domain-containing protein [Candidatus Mcinerneyibacterium aminivorans]
MDKNNIEKQIKSILVDYDQIKLAFMFGSFVNRGFHENSDIDIAVAGREKLDYGLMVEIQNKLSKNLEREVDLLDFNKLNGLILKQILTGGKLIVNKDSSLYAELIKRMLEFQEDIFPNIKSIYKTRVKRFING